MWDDATPGKETHAFLFDWITRSPLPPLRATSRLAECAVSYRNMQSTQDRDARLSSLPVRYVSRVSMGVGARATGWRSRCGMHSG